MNANLPPPNLIGQRALPQVYKPYKYLPPSISFGGVPTSPHFAQIHMIWFLLFIVYLALVVFLHFWMRVTYCRRACEVHGWFVSLRPLVCANTILFFRLALGFDG